MSDTSRADAISKTLGDVQSVGDAARQTGEKARQAGVDALDQARDVMEDARSRAESVAGTLRDQAASAAETHKADLAERLEDVAKAVHRSGEQLEGHQDWVAGLVERGADELSALATTLRSNDLQSLLGDLGSLARRQPALFVGASMAAGFALARIGRLAASGAPSTGSSSGSAPSTAPVPAPVAPPAPFAGPGVGHERQ